MPYVRFTGLVAAASAAILGLICLFGFAIDRASVGPGSVWPALVLAAAAAAGMLLLLPRMYRLQALNLAIIVSCGAIYLASIWLVRSQQAADSVAYAPPEPAAARSSSS